MDDHHVSVWIIIMDGSPSWMDGWIDGWMDGSLMDGRMGKCCV